MEYVKLKNIAKYPTGKLDSNAAVEGGQYPFFTCAQTAAAIDTFAYDGEYVLLGGNNANGNFPVFYYKGKFNAYQRTYLIQPTSDNIDTKYLYYAVQLKLNQMRSNASGTATKFLTKPILDNINIEYRRIDEQRCISSILSAYDDLIENNNRRIKILEQMAENLYKEWFVRLRFPGYEQAEFENGIPKGWEIRKIKDCIKRLPYNRLYKASELKSAGKVIVIDQSTAEYLGYHDNEPSHSASYDLPIILFGDHSCKFKLMCSNFSLGENVIPFTVLNQEKDNTYFLYYAVHKLINTEEYKRHWNRLMNMKILKPSQCLQNKFAEFSIFMQKQKQNLFIQNQNLTKQRDMLLPRLMSGKLEV